MKNEEDVEKSASGLGLSMAQYRAMLTRIERARVAKNLTQAELGRLLGGVSQSRVSDVLSAKVGIGRAMLHRFAHALHTDPSLLLGWKLRTRRKSNGDTSDHIATDRLFNCEVRFAESQDVTSIYQLSAEIFPPEVMFTEEAVGGWVNRGHYRVIVEKDHSTGLSLVIGYHGIWPLSQRVYEWVRDNPGRENELRPQMGCRLDSDELYGIYILDLLGPKDDPFLRSRLCVDLTLYVNHLCDRHHQIQRIGAWAYTPQGKTLCPRLGLRLLKSEFYEIESKSLFNGDLTQAVQSILEQYVFQERYRLP